MNREIRLFVQLCKDVDDKQAACVRVSMNPRPGRAGKEEKDALLEARAQLDRAVREAMEVVTGGPGFLDDAVRKLVYFNAWAELRGGWT